MGKTNFTFEDMTVEEIEDKVTEIKEELFNLRFRNHMRQLDNPLTIRERRRDLARCLTALSEHKAGVRRFPAIVPISVRKLRKLTSTSGNPAQARAPGLSRTFTSTWFRGQVMPRTKITAKPRPIAVSTFLETARKEHIPRKKARAMFSTKIAFVARLK